MKKRILLVDDIKEFRSLLKVILSGTYDVITAEDGEKALRMIDAGCDPDVIVTDLIMPGMDGYQLITKMKSRSARKKIPIIVLSHVDAPSEKQKLIREQGVYGYMNKPFTANELTEGLEKSLETAFSNHN